ncbi:MAG: universal stress protein [Polyangiales bacterium]|nr:universal stress protein [Myxococcales bacterium]MCB9659260.1 universal stress protein [Sandaracinaceae bacterium]
MTGTADRLLVAADLSFANDAAVRFAASVAKALSLSLELVHVVDTAGTEPLADSADPAVQVYLRELQKRLTDRLDAQSAGLEAERALVEALGVPCTSHLTNGRVWEAILTRGREVDARFVVVGPHSKGPGERLLGALGEWLLGSTADRVVRHAHCPVWVVPGVPAGDDVVAPQGPAASLARIMVAVDFSPASMRGLAIAADLARGAGGSLHLVHLLPHGYRGDSSSPCAEDITSAPSTIVANDAKARLHRVALSAAEGGVTVHEDVRVVNHSFHEELLEAAREADATEVVLGSHSRSVLDHLVLGSTAERMLRRATVPTLVVRG